jgi:tol-pal system beta propeller repeat protein TolB
MAEGAFAQQGAVTLRVTTASISRAPICVLPFTAPKDSAFAGQLPSALRGVIDGDLAYCGYFNVIEPQDLPPDTIVQVRQNQKGKWDTLRTFSGSTASRVQGQISMDWNGASASIAILQPPIKTPIHSKNFAFKPEDMRPAGHQIAAWITKMVTGEDGSFSAKLAFVVKSGNNKNLWIMDWDGANPHPLTSDNTLNMSPSWTPDGKTLFFTSFRAGNASLYRYNMGSGHVSPFVVQPGVTSAASVSPDGEWVAYSATAGNNQEIFRAHPDGSSRTQLTFSYGIDTSPSWAPTSRELLFTSDRTGEPQIYTMDFEGANVQRLTMAGNYNETGRWSPRGDLIAYASREIGFQIFTISPDGTGERRVTGDAATATGAWAMDPSWSPDGMKLAYTIKQGNSYSVWTCNWDGSNQRQLTFGTEASQPQWGPATSIAIAADSSTTSTQGH